MKWKINPFTGLPDLTGDGGGGGGGDGIQTINGRKPNANKNFNITSQDIPDASENAKGGAPLATSEETIAGTVPDKIVTPKTLSDKLGDQTRTYFGIGNGKDKPIEWAPISSDTLNYSYDPANKKIILNIKDAPKNDWSTVRMTEDDYQEYAVDKTIYIADRAGGACTIAVKDNAEYKDHAEFEVYSLRHGFQIAAENPEKGEVQFRYMDEYSTKGSGVIRSPRYGNPKDDLSWIKLTFYKSLGLWIAQYYSSTNFEVN